ncbi:hypothetical protein [Xenorhabdus bovienii]|uniref:hypothetical protein n=1 Tax=Xenorhabdus bovienii TaxID=40576 RepID=UPI0023B33E80|nr:hypothetical protein [Xenorhabdus bovienii]MDE9553276.1 hypothetical protein [Xenorhabdus bovienii]
MDLVKSAELINNHGWIGFLLFIFMFLLFIFTIVNVHTTLLYKVFVLFNPEKNLSRKIKSLRRISNNEKISEDIRALAKNEEIRIVNSFYLKCNLSVDAQNTWAKLIRFHKNKNIPMELYKRAYSLFPVKDSRLVEEISPSNLIRIWIVTVFQIILLLFVGALGSLSLVAYLGAVDGGVKLSLFFFSYFIIFILFLAFFSSGIPNYFSYSKIKQLIKEYNEMH